MNFVVFPAQALRDTQGSPLFFPEQFKGSFRAVKVVGWDLFEHVFGKLDMAVFKLIIRISRRVMDGVDKFLEPFSFGFQQKAGFLIPPAHVDVHLEG